MGTDSSKPVIPVVDIETGERLSTSELALEAMKAEMVKSSPKSSVHHTSNIAPIIPTTSTQTTKQKPKGSIDSLASKLLAKQTITPSANDRTSELQNIFGPEEPLQVIFGHEAEQQIDEPEKSDEGPSELELLALELSNQLAKEKQMKQQAEAEAEQAAKREKEEEEEVIMQNHVTEKLYPEVLTLDDDEQGYSMHHHDPKYKFKQLNKPPQTDESRNTSSPGPPTPVKINLTQNSVVDSNPLRRMRKKELLNQYYGIEIPVPAAPVQIPITNGPTVSIIETPSNHHGHSGHTREPVRMNIIKMPKAVASVTSVPTRADYQSQLEANLERKRKREGKEDTKKGKGGKGSKGNKKNVWEEPYKPKIKMTQEELDGESEQTKEVRRTRGKPPKKCLAVDDSPERDPVESFIENKKNESLKFAEEVLKSFDQDEDRPGKDRRRKDKKKRRRENDDDFSQPNTKTPRIVIKFSKNKDPPKNIPKDNGLIKPPGQKLGESEVQKKLPKLKIKNLIEPNKT